MGIKPIDIRKIEAKAANVYEALVVLSKRARQINADTKIEFEQRIETIAALAAPQPHDENEEPKANPDQIRVSVEFEKRKKSTEIAINELLSNELTHKYPEDSK